MKKKRNIPLIVIGASIPFMWCLVALLTHLGFFGWMNDIDMGEIPQTIIIDLIANIPVLVFIVYGIYCVVTSPSTIPKVKERMPWEKDSARDIDKEWREKLKEKEQE